jgi:hypothetical protein
VSRATFNHATSATVTGYAYAGGVVYTAALDPLADALPHIPAAEAAIDDALERALETNPTTRASTRAETRTP